MFASLLFSNVGVVLIANLMSTNSYSTYHKEEYKGTSSSGLGNII